ncbi:MAG: siderophore-interacting protein [Rhodobacteraceae bacterium]|nr:siderophore-interacting protein [Paracoccaceae bacterium]
MITSNPPERTPLLLSVLRTARITPNMIRVTLTGPAVSGLPADCAGGHCKLLIPMPGQTRAEFLAQMQNGPRPTTRTYTVRSIRCDTNEIDIDFVAHDNPGPASSWAELATDLDFCGFAGPGRPKLTRFDADWYLIAADMSALPLASAALEIMPKDARGVAVFEIMSPEDRQEIIAPRGIVQHWIVNPNPHKASTVQEDLITRLDWPNGRVKTLIAGETSAVRSLRFLVRAQRAVDRKDAYASGYWHIGMTEDGHQQVKRAQTDADEAALATY